LAEWFFRKYFYVQIRTTLKANLNSNLEHNIEIKWKSLKYKKWRRQWVNLKIVGLYLKINWSTDISASLKNYTNINIKDRLCSRSCLQTTITLISNLKYNHNWKSYISLKDSLSIKIYLNNKIKISLNSNLRLEINLSSKIHINLSY